MLNAMFGSWRPAASAVLLLSLGCGEDTVSASGTDGVSGSSTVDGTSGTDDRPSSSSGSSGESSGTADPDTGSESSDGGDTTGERPPVEPVPLEGPSVSLGQGASCQVTADGALSCWGDGRCGLFGDGTQHARGPEVIGDSAAWNSLSLGGAHGCGIENDGALWCWGDGREGRVGDGGLDEFPFSLNCRLDRVELEPLGGWAQVSSGDAHTCAVRQDGTMWCWGNNEAGQIGDGAVGSLYNRLVPVQVGPASDWLEVFAGVNHSCGRRRDETLWCWGEGVAVGDGVGAAISSQPVMVAGPTTWQALPRGLASRHTCALDTEGAVWCWGETYSGALGPGAESESLAPVPVELPGPVARIAVGREVSCAVLEGGAVWCWGANRDGELGLPLDVEQSDVPVEPHPGLVGQDVRIGAGTICVTDEAEQVTCWGRNRSGEVGDQTSGADNTPRIEPVAVGESAVANAVDDWDVLNVGASHGCGIRSDDSLWCWGSRGSGRLGNADELEDCFVSNPSDCHFTTPVEVSGDQQWSAVAIGGSYTCALDEADALWCWGRGGSGGTAVDVSQPTAVLAGTTWVSLAAGESHSCGVQTDGTLWCWGAGSQGQLGLGTQGSGVSQSAPTQVGADADWVHVVAGTLHTCALRSDDTLWCWGFNRAGQIGNGEETSGLPFGEVGVADPFEVPGSWVAVDAGSAHTCAVDDAGALWCWGDNDSGAAGQDIDGADVVLSPVQVGNETDWEQLGLGENVSCATKTDGRLLCWGSRAHGAVGDGTIAVESPTAQPVQVGADDDEWVSIESGHRTVCGAQSDGSSWCWGQNLNGQQGNDTVFDSGLPRRVVQ